MCNLIILIRGFWNLFKRDQAMESNGCSNITLPPLDNWISINSPQNRMNNLVSNCFSRTSLADILVFISNGTNLQPMYMEDKGLTILGEWYGQSLSFVVYPQAYGNSHPVHKSADKHSRLCLAHSKANLGGENTSMTWYFL